jgi:hypothetical protein
MKRSGPGFYPKQLRQIDHQHGVLNYEAIKRAECGARMIHPEIALNID